MYYIGVDIGGTFTDCVLVDRAGNHRTAKTLSTRDDPVSGVLTGLELLAETAGVDLPTLLERTDRFGHGTTIGTNAVLERRGARAGVVATAGHGDALALMRGAGRVAGRSIEGVFSVHGSRLPAPLIVPGAVLEVHERVDASGKVVVELDIDKDGCAVLERPLRDVAPEFASRGGRAGHRTRYREYLCPVTGLRVDSEIVKEGDEALHDIEIGAGR
jgi:N-methylhydantoinase A/oxoprolinase/acetone carboxylase beta subunit